MRLKASQADTVLVGQEEIVAFVAQGLVIIIYYILNDKYPYL